MFAIAMLLAGVAGAYWFVRSHPLVFLESFWGHAHCIKMAGLDLRRYGAENGDRFPVHTNGYGNALLLMTNAWLPSLTGPGYSAGAFEKARTERTALSESECGRVYIQGLSETNSSEIVVLFDKLPTPGGDHCHGPARLFRPLVREVMCVDGSMRIIQERDWPEFSRKQIELLVKTGIPRGQAEAYYAEKAKPELLQYLKP